MKKNITAYLLILPALIVLSIFGIYALGFVCYAGFFKWSMSKEGFIGLDNYISLFTNTELISAFIVTLYYALGTIICSISIAVIIASLIHGLIRFAGLFRTIYFLPYVTSAVAMAVVWGWLFEPRQGIINYCLEWIGLQPLNWLMEPRGIFEIMASGIGISMPEFMSGPSLSLTCVILFSIWHSLGFNILVILGGLSAIPQEVEEAADLDGAGWWTRLIRIRIPLITPILLFLVVISTIRSFQAFNDIYTLIGEITIMDTTQNMTMYIFELLYNRHNYGLGSAVAMILFFLILGLSLAQFQLSKRKIHYGN